GPDRPGGSSERKLPRSGKVLAQRHDAWRVWLSVRARSRCRDNAPLGNTRDARQSLRCTRPGGPGTDEARAGVTAEAWRFLRVVLAKLGNTFLLWVMGGKPRTEHISPGCPPIADL